MGSSVREVVIIPSYCEVEALPVFLEELLPLLPITTCVVICDDSPLEIFQALKKELEKIKTTGIDIKYNHSESKAGRGAAVKRGLMFAQKEFPSCVYFVECDADGSHRPEDVLRVLTVTESADLVIGSRYLPESIISNWPKSRRVFSKILNKTIPMILRMDINDVTNGLRRYSISATNIILEKESRNAGFTYLSEQALVVTKAKLRVLEIPIHFIDRIHGHSTITYREITQSIKGIFKLIPMSLR